MRAHGIGTVLVAVVAAALSSSQAAAICSDSVIDPTEECDDGNLTSGDGCFSTCHFEDEFVLGGVGTSGPGAVKVWIFGFVSAVPGLDGQSPNSVLTDLAAEINANATLAGLGVSAVVIGNRLVTNATITGVDVKDPGLAECGGFSVPVLTGWGLGLLALALGGAALLKRRVVLASCVALCLLTSAPTASAQECTPHPLPDLSALGDPIDVDFGPDSTIVDVLVLLKVAYLRPWVANQFALDITITSLNGGLHFHGTDVVLLSDMSVFSVGGNQALVVVPWTEDNEPEVIGDVYTVCSQLVLGATAAGPERCQNFGPF